MNAAERAAALTSQIVAYSGKGRFQLKRVDLSAEVCETTPLIRSAIEKNAEITLNLGQGLPRIQADHSQIQQLIINLATNGTEALEGKVGQINITTSVTEVAEDPAARTFTPDRIEPGRYVSLAVEDSGMGMSEETISRIFDPFFTTKFVGRGLGLAAVSGIVRGHRGALKVVSALGQGTTFEVLLPAFAPLPEEPNGKSCEDAAPCSPTVLFVDDEEVIQRVGRHPGAARLPGSDRPRWPRCA